LKIARPRRWQDKIKTDLRKIGCEDRRMEMAKDRVLDWVNISGTEPSEFITI
jgi:hypothetical protein